MVRCGIAGWIDRSLIESGFYPSGCSSSEDRLRFYSSQFPMVEVDSTYYGMASRRNLERWAGWTPEGFLFDVKAFSLFTHHPTRPNALPREIREQLEPELQRKNLYLEKAPDEVVDAAWDAFRDALEPLRAAGKLGAVFFQFPPWFMPSRRSLAYIESCQERLFGIPIAVEFRRRDWMDGEHAAGTAAFLRSLDIPYVTVDAPQGFPTSMPPSQEVTSRQLAVVRFHGRNRATWDQKGAPPSVRFRHLYSDDELREWVPRIRRMEETAREVHAIMNNNYSNYSVRNAHQMERLLESAPGGEAPAM
ncbi:MAG: DUF72 domain-containing protein [Candidatus Dormibacteraceae bacterium]